MLPLNNWIQRFTVERSGVRGTSFLADFGVLEINVFEILHLLDAFHLFGGPTFRVLILLCEDSGHPPVQRQLHSKSNFQSAPTTRKGELLVITVTRGGP